MKIKLMPFFAGVLTFAFVVAPLAAQACDGSKDKSASDSDLTEQTQTRVLIEEAIINS